MDCPLLWQSSGRHVLQYHGFPDDVMEASVGKLACKAILWVEFQKYLDNNLERTIQKHLSNEVGKTSQQRCTGPVVRYPNIAYMTTYDMAVWRNGIASDYDILWNEIVGSKPTIVIQLFCSSSI